MKKKIITVAILCLCLISFLNQSNFKNSILLNSVESAVSLTANEEENLAVKIYEQKAQAVVFIKALKEDPEKEEVHIVNGSGFIIDPNGTILTVKHVVNGASMVKLQTADGTIWPAEVIRISKSSDLALIKIKSKRLLPFLRLEQPVFVKPGRKVFIIGAPYSIAWTLTQGWVSRMKGQNNWLQLNAQINPGNSGGPIIDSNGKVIGVAVAMFSDKDNDDNNVGISYAVSLSTINAFLNGKD